MEKKVLIALSVLVNMVYVCQAQNAVVKMFPENGATNVNIDTHLTLTMSDDVVIGKQGFVSVYDLKTGKLVDRLDMSIPAGPTKSQPKNPNAQYTPVPYLYRTQHITNRNTPGIRTTISLTLSADSLTVSISIPSSPTANS